MKYKNKLLYGVLPVALIGLSVGGVAFARGFGGGMMMGMGSVSTEEVALRHTEMFASQAQILGLSTDEVKSAWANGTTMKELMTQKGIKESDVLARAQATREAQMKTHMKALVDKGVITQAQADSRLKIMQEKMTTGKGMMGEGKGMRGFNR